ncbi:MAG TPA: alpha/beta hydrolase [Blastocatellia bacterium]|nr:alpha/beta hydrolase [Blastocatellia bacterium]
MKQKLAISAIAAVAIALLFVAASAAKARADESQKSLGAAKSHYATLDGSRVHYKSLGKGDQALVFVHGWTCNMNFWDSQVPAFADKTRVIAIDLPGHGQSDKPQASYTMDFFARAIDAVLRDAKVEKAALVGHSMGTPVIRQFYRKYPQKTLALVIVDGALRPFGKKEQMETFLAPLRGPNYKETAGRFIDGMLGPVKSVELRQQIKDSMLSTPQHVAVGAMDGMNDESLWGPDKINVPVLAILAKSPFWPPDNEQFLRSLAPNLEYHMWDGVSHFLMMEKPAEFNDTLAAFLVKNGFLKK